MHNRLLELEITVSRDCILTVAGALHVFVVSDSARVAQLSVIIYGYAERGGISMRQLVELRVHALHQHRLIVSAPCHRRLNTEWVRCQGLPWGDEWIGARAGDIPGSDDSLTWHQHLVALCLLLLLFGKFFEITDGILNLISNVYAQAFDVANEELLEAPQQVRLLRLPNYVDYLNLEAEFGNGVELAEYGLNCKLEDGQIDILPDLSHRIQPVMQGHIFVQQSVF